MLKKAKKILLSGIFGSRLNVRYKAWNADGSPKKLFQPNFIATYLLRKGIIGPRAKKNMFLGRWVYELEIPNLITNYGLAVSASRYNGAGSEAVVNYIAIGIGTGAANATDVALGSEITTGGGQRAIASVDRVTDTVTNDTARSILTFTLSSSFAITESGLFNGASGNNCCAREVFLEINLGAGDSFQVTWENTFIPA